MSRPTESEEQENLLEFMKIELIPLGAVFDGVPGDLMGAIALAIVKWQREREDLYLVVSVPADGIQDGLGQDCVGTAIGSIQ